MDYQEFKETVVSAAQREAIKLELDVDIEEREIRKNNDSVLDGIVLSGSGELSAVAYISDLYEWFKEGAAMDEIVMTIMEKARDVSAEKDIKVSQINDWDMVKDKVVLQVIGEAENKEYQKEIPNRKEEDLLLTYRVILDINDRGISSYQVTNANQEMLGVSEEELYQAAVHNTERVLPTEIKAMEEIIFELEFGNQTNTVNDLDTALQGLDKRAEMYVLTNQFRTYGAAAVFCPGVMDKIAEAFGSDMVVLPSSIQETILVPCREEMPINIEELKGMVIEINETQVDARDKLTDQVYIYDKDAQKLMIADKWQERKLAKEQSPKQSIRDSLKDKKEQVAGMPEPTLKKPLDKGMEH